MTLARTLGLAIGICALAASPALAAPLKVACVGASTTAGSGSTDGHHFPDELGRLLGAGYAVKNFGVGGTTMLKKGDKPYWNTPEMKAALAYVPDIAIFWFGGNDSKAVNWDKHEAEFLPDYEDMVRMFQALPSHARTYVILSLVVHDVSGIRKDVLDNEVVPLLRRVAAETGSGVIDAHGMLANHPEYFPDGVHPNNAGTLAVAKLAQAAMTAAPPDAGAPDAAGAGDPPDAAATMPDAAQAQGGNGAGGAAGAGGNGQAGSGGANAGGANAGGATGGGASGAGGARPKPQPRDAASEPDEPAAAAGSGSGGGCAIGSPRPLAAPALLALLALVVARAKRRR